MTTSASITTPATGLLSDYQGQELFSVAQAQKILCISRATVWRMVSRGQLDTVLIGDRRLIRRSSIAKLIERGCEVANG